MPRRNYKEGQWFSITVPEEDLLETPELRFGAGLIARGKRGSTAFVYVFGPFAGEPAPQDLAVLGPGDELVRLVMSDTGLRDGSLPIIWTDTTFSRDRWPMPELGMYMGGDNQAWAIRTTDDNPFDGVEKRPVSPAVALALPQYAVYGYGTLFDALGKPSVRVHRVSDLWGRPSAPIADGSTVWRECSVEFAVPADQTDQIEALRTQLAALGWAVTVRENEPGPAEPSGAWVTGTRAADLELASSISAIDREMEEIAAALGIEYDGHGFARDDPAT